ncbi:LysR family transcriptional regulator [Neobacillus niacini]|uniref:LysR family transcriptional regulator n=1 Tax=Neobacillus niacini TaxID=86668 RepID=UPI0030012E4F
MDLLQLSYFKVVAHLEHMTRAAEELHISQPSLSKAIIQLEKQLGVPLFDRIGKRIRLNPFGKAFLLRVDRVFQELKEAKIELADLSGHERGLVLLGTTTTRLLPNLLCEYLEQYPQVNIRLHQIPTRETMLQLEKGEIDLLISSPPLEQPGISTIPILNEEIFLVVSPKHHLASYHSVCLRDIASEPFIHLTMDYEYRHFTNLLCNQAGFEPNIVFESNDPEVILSMVKSGLGVALIPDNWWNNTGVKEAPVRLHIEEPNCYRTIGLSWVASRYMSVASRDFQSFIFNYFSKLSAQNKKGF